MSELSPIQKMYAKQPRRWVVNTIFAVALVIAIVFTFAGSTINWTRLQNLDYTLGAMFRRIIKIEWRMFLGLAPFEFKESIVYLLLETFAIGFLGTFIGAILAIPFGFLAAENIVGKKIAKTFEIVLLLIRVFPEIILAIILVKGFGMNAFSGMLTIGLHSIGMLGKLFSEAIENMEKAPLEALDSVGANIWQKIRYGVIPNIMPDLSSITLYRLDINVRSASILGLVSAGGIGSILTVASSMWSWELLGTILLGVIAMVMIVDFVSSNLRKKLV